MKCKNNRKTSSITDSLRKDKYNSPRFCPFFSSFVSYDFSSIYKLFDSEYRVDIVGNKPCLNGGYPLKTSIKGVI